MGIMWNLIIMRKIDGKKLHIILPNTILNDLSEVNLILGKDRSTLIRSAIQFYINDLRDSGKLAEGDNSTKENGENIKDIIK
jgi:predicted DNA-binding protein